MKQLFVLELEMFNVSLFPQCNFVFPLLAPKNKLLLFFICFLLFHRQLMDLFFCAAGAPEKRT